MLLDRGYATSQQILTFEDFSQKYSSVQNNSTILNFVASKQECGEGKTLGVYFSNDEKLSKVNLEKIIQDYISQGVNSIVLITTAKLNPSCKALVKASKLQVEHFLIEELQFNVTKHVLVPRHRILSPQECEELLSKLKTDRGKLPAILTTDVVCRYIGGRVGDIIEIDRKSLTSGQSLYYRAVREM